MTQNNLNEFTVRYGDVDLNWFFGNYWNEVGIHKFFKHPSYHGEDNDIALLQLSSKVPATAHPICLHNWDNERDRFAKCYAVGWGQAGKCPFITGYGGISG